MEKRIRELNKGIQVNTNSITDHDADILGNTNNIMLRVKIDISRYTRHWRIRKYT